jgi:hypothetical protein
LICEIALKLDPSSLDHIYKLISTITPKNFDEGFIKLIREFSLNAMICLNRDNGKTGKFYEKELKEVNIKLYSIKNFKIEFKNI